MRFKNRMDGSESVEPDPSGAAGRTGDLFLVILAFCILGLVAGVLSGFSRESILGAVLPPVLSLIGGLAIYLLDRGRAVRVLISVSVIGLAVNLMVGALWGAVLRDASINSFAALETRRIVEQRKASIEGELLIFRMSLGLPPKDIFGKN